MIDTPRKVPLTQITEWFMAEQRAHYARALDDAVRQIDALELDDTLAQQIIAAFRGMIASALARAEGQIATLAARGMRTEDEPLH